jgi:hypothetical protein
MSFLFVWSRSRFFWNGTSYEVSCFVLWVLGSWCLNPSSSLCLGVVRFANYLLGFCRCTDIYGLCVRITGGVTFTQRRIDLRE